MEVAHASGGLQIDEVTALPDPIIWRVGQVSREMALMP